MVQIPTELHKQLSERAEADGRSLSSFILEILKHCDRPYYVLPSSTDRAFLEAMKKGPSDGETTYWREGVPIRENPNLAMFQGSKESDD